jgi:glycosyltransferase involved in cell wall biosynthesis
MRILLDLQACQASSMHRGIGRYSMALALAMARNSGGHELRIVLNEDYPDSVATIRKAFDGLLPQSHITTFATPVPISEVDSRNRWRLRAAERIREHYLSSLRPDIVHLASLFEGLGDNSVTSVPDGDDRFDHAVTLYDLIPLMHKKRYLRDPNMAAWYYRKLDGLKRAGLLLAISDSARREAIDLLELAPAQVVNISSAADTIFRPRVLSPEARAALLARHGLRREFVMYTGGIDYRKNIEGLIEAYAKLPGQLRRQYQLAVVCSIRPPDRSRLERLAAKHGLSKDDVVLTGFVSDDDLVSLYNLATLFVFPSLHEGFGLPVLEAMACGAPVIGSNTSSIPEVIGRADAMFDPTDIDAISASMVQVLRDPGRQAALREHGLSQASRFSWNASAQRAIEAFEAHRRRCDMSSARVASPPARKPRLAFVSSPCPARSTIAASGTSLLPELARHFDIEPVVVREDARDPALKASFAQRSAEWFGAHAHTFDHIVYQFGESSFHTDMPELLERHPGVVVLEDFPPGCIASHAGTDKHPSNHYCISLYRARGYGALIEKKTQAGETPLMACLCNKAVLDRATGVIVHPAHAAALANHWHGPGFADEWRVLPLMCLQSDQGSANRPALRAELGFGVEDFVVCSFGIPSGLQCSGQLVEAWIDSTLAHDPHCQLVFIGDIIQNRFGIALRERIAAHPRIRVTGHVSTALYRQYLTAADIAVQLGNGADGAASGAVSDCLSCGLPTIVNGPGLAAEVPPQTCLRLDDGFGQDALRMAMESLRSNATLRVRLGSAAAAYTETTHTPARIAALYRNAITQFASYGAHQAEHRLIASIATLGDDVPSSDLLQTAAAIAANRARRELRQVLVEIDSLIAAGGTAAQSGLLIDMIGDVPDGWRIEPIRHDGKSYRYARRYTLDLLGYNDLRIDDAPVDAKPGDLMLRLSAGVPADVPPKWLARGVRGCQPEGASPAEIRQWLVALLDSQQE